MADIKAVRAAGGTRRIADAKWETYWECRKKKGMSIAASARKAGISASACYKIENGKTNSSGLRVRKQLDDTSLPDVIPYKDLSQRAKRALEDFAYFRKIYFGRVATPWQTEAAYRIVEWLESDRDEFVVINVPPGAGKSTAFTHDIPAWLTCRNRNIRGLIGSRTSNQARGYVNRLRNTFDRSIPVKNEARLVAAGMAYDATTTLLNDFGRFQPLRSQRWREDEIVVAQPDDVTSADKESSWTAYGMDSGFLGGRFDFIIWDDLIDKRTVGMKPEQNEDFLEWWSSEAETRLEPGGLFILQGQRLRGDDLYRHCLDMRSAAFDVHGREISDGTIPKYQHIMYKAHDETKCTGEHPLSLKAWPQSCLLDPVRLGWAKLRTVQMAKEDRFRVVYQQEDVDPDTVLVQKIWVSGGKGDDGVDYPGCWDTDRRMGVKPKVDGELISIACVDPSGEQNWGVTWWAYSPRTEMRYLINLYRGHMMANQLLDRAQDLQGFTGLMEDWQDYSRRIGLPISTWIVEINAAQRYLLAYDHVREWQSKNGINIVKHSTGLNKLDPEWGIEGTLPNRYRYGQVRLPGWRGDNSFLSSMKLVTEVTSYPHGGTTDLAMSQWFLEANLPKLVRPKAPPRQQRPTWMQGERQRPSWMQPALKAVS